MKASSVAKVPLFLLCIFLLGSCLGSAKPDTAGSTKDGIVRVKTSASDKDSRTAAAATVISENATNLPESPEKTIIKGEADGIQASAGTPQPKDLDDARKRAADVKAGKPEAEAAYTELRQTNAALKAQHDQDIKNMEDLEKRKDKEKADAIKQARADHDARLWTMVGIGLFAAGVVAGGLVLYFKLNPAGPVLLIVGGILASLTGRLLDSDLFVFCVGALLVVTIAGGIWVVASGVLRSKAVAKATAEGAEELEAHRDTLAIVVNRLDKTIFNNPDVTKDLKEAVRNALRGPMEQEHKDIVTQARATGATMKLDN